MAATPKVFISYSWDGEAHKKWVLDLADRLTTEGGVEVLLDQYEMRAGRNLNHFMERAVAEADKVLLILTENYKRKAKNREGGIGFEYSMITTEWFQNQTGKVKFIPVLRGEKRADCVPNFVQSFLSVNMQNDADFAEEFRKLLFDIYDEPIVAPPPRGKRPDFDDLRKAQNTPTADPPSAGSIRAEREKYQRQKAVRALQTEVRDLVTQGKTAAAIKKIAAYAESQNDDDLQNEMILLSARQAGLARQIRLGTIEDEQKRVNENQIIQAVLQVMQAVVKNV